MKYLIYELFSGVGFCNQLFSLETAIYLANITSRKLILLVKSSLCHCGRTSWNYGHFLDFFSDNYKQFLPYGIEVYYKVIPENIKNIIASSECNKLVIPTRFSAVVFVDSQYNMDKYKKDIRLFCNGRDQLIMDFDKYNDEYIYINKSNASRCFYNFYTNKERYMLMSNICNSLSILNTNITNKFVNIDNKYDVSIHLRLGDYHKTRDNCKYKFL